MHQYRPQINKNSKIICNIGIATIISLILTDMIRVTSPGQSIYISLVPLFLVIIGTSMNVYPAAGLIHYAPAGISIYIIDPNEVGVAASSRITHIKEGAGKGVALLKEMLKDE